MMVGGALPGVKDCIQAVAGLEGMFVWVRLALPNCMYTRINSKHTTPSKDMAPLKLNITSVGYTNRDTHTQTDGNDLACCDPHIH